MSFSRICLVITISFGAVNSAFISYEDDPLEEAIADCVLNISKTYFNQELPTVLLMPDTWYRYEDPIERRTDKFLQIYSKYNDIPGVTIANTNTPRIFRQPNIIYPGSYIMMAPEKLSNLKQEWENWVQDMLHRIQENVENAKARFVIVLNWYSTHFTNSVSKSLLDWAYNSGFSDVIVVMSKGKKSRKVSNLDIFGWLSEEQTNLCAARISKIRRFDMWISEKKIFVFNRNLFPSKRIVTKDDCRISVFHGVAPPFAYKVNGVIFGAIPELLKYGVEPNFIPFGEWKNHSHNNIVFPIKYKIQDGIRECSWTYPIFAADITWYVPIGHKIEPWRSLYKAFTPEMWVLVIFTSAFCNLSLWMIQKIKQVYFGIKRDIDNSIVTTVVLTHLGVGVKDSYSGSASVLLFSLLLFYSLLINTAYQSTLFGLMVEPGEYPPIKTIEELEASNLRLKALERTFHNGIVSSEKYEHCNATCFLQITENSDYAVLIPKQLGEILRGYILREHGTQKVLSLTEMVTTYYLGMSIRRINCIVFMRLESLLFRAASSGLIHKWNNEYVQLCRIKFYKYKSQNLPKLSIWHLQGAFYLLMVGVLGSVLIFFAEIIVYNFYSMQPRTPRRHLCFCCLTVARI
ncbi:Ionotropic receptor 379 [Blattella germanica]|nr:Ionotropic receptor 379 [Blattella germanica]